MPDVPVTAVVLGVILMLPVVASEVKLEVTSPLGARFYSLPDAKGAVAEAGKKLAADPSNTSLMLKLALAQSSVRLYREAVATCTKALEKAPENADLYLERGHRELGLREFKHARDDLARAAELNAKNSEIFYHLGLAYYFEGEFAESAEAFGHSVDLAPNIDSRINATNWVYAALRRANRPEEAAKALSKITPDMKNEQPHAFFYLSLVRLFQGRMPESDVVPPQPPPGKEDTEAELRFDTVAYGVGNWYLYNGHKAKAQEYFHRVVTGHVWITWGFIGSELEVARAKAQPPLRPLK